jgi:hypothetical protein
MRYLLTLHIDEAAREEMAPDALQESVARWGRFDRDAAEAGVLIACEALQPAATATTIRHRASEPPLVTDGPFAETKEQIGGFVLLDCADLDEAMRWARRVPVEAPWAIEVRPIIDYAAVSAVGSDDEKRLAVGRGR